MNIARFEDMEKNVSHSSIKMIRPGIWSTKKKASFFIKTYHCATVPFLHTFVSTVGSVREPNVISNGYIFFLFHKEIRGFRHDLTKYTHTH